MGLHEPQSLDEWAELPLGRNTLPWLRGKELDRLRRMLDFFLLNNQLRKATKDHPRLRSSVRRALGAPLRWRIRSNKYSFPWELWVGKKVEKIITRRSLVTGQPLGAEGAEAC
jgi:anaerobic magnesium-protoporphyrin IX monomethyl ester cyclase